MSFKFKSIVFFIAILTVVSFSSCKDDDEVNAPVISNTEIGEDNSMTATVGGELHMDAEIVADGKIDRITVDLHLEDGSGEDIEAEYTSYADLKNADFHEDLAIPASATPGEYHFHLTVIDQEGNSTDIEADVDIQ